MLIVLTLLTYFAVLTVVSRLTARHSDNETFFRGNRRSPWYMVAFGMVGASISGVTFVSVPGMPMSSDMTYLQMCLGFIVGYFVVAFVLLPVYYRLNLTTIYSYLDHRLGRRSYLTGASFFLLSKLTGAAVRFYVVCLLLHHFVVSPLVPAGNGWDSLSFCLTAMVMVALIWVYTRRGGIRTLVWTDTFQTLCLFAALCLIIVSVAHAMGLSLSDAVSTVAADSHSRIFEWDWLSRQNFWKQFVSGIFVVVVMTGLDQDMMQKNLTCRSLRDAQKDMCTYGFLFFPANLLFLSLGVLLMLLAAREGTPLPSVPDDLLPMFAATGSLGTGVVVLFTIGIMAACFSSADSALTALTTSFCVDICQRPSDERLRRRAHIGICVVFTLFIIAFRTFNSTSIIDAIYILCSYTYGPLLGLFAFGLLTRRQFTRASVGRDRLVPWVCVASPLLCYAASTATALLTDYRFGYELLLLNGLLTFAGLWLLSRPRFLSFPPGIPCTDSSTTTVPPR